MRILLTELHLSWRRLWRRPAQAGMMFGTFAVSITLTLISWSLFHTIFLQSAEYDPGRALCLIAQGGLKAPRPITGYSSPNRIGATREDYMAWKQQQAVFDDFAAVILYNSVFVTTENGTERLLSANISTDALRVFGAQPLLGRLFSPEEDKFRCAPVIMISEGTWRNKYAADPKIIGRVVTVDGGAATIVGVMPASFRFPNEQEMWQPLGFSPFEYNPQMPVFDVIGRLKPGISHARAIDDLAQITARRGSATLAARFELKPVISPFREYYLAPELHQSALILLALSLVFVLVSCANAANLVMIDFFGRSAETAASVALGIPRIAVVRGLGFQLALASGLAALVGSGVLVAVAPHLYQSLVLPNVPYWLVFTWQWHHLAVAAGLAFACAGVALLVPLGYMLFANPEDFIRRNNGSSRASGHGWWRQALLIGQVALLTVLAVSAGLLLRSSQTVAEKNWGYEARTLFASKTAMKNADFNTPAKRLALQRRMIAEFEKLPSVQSAAVMSGPIGFSGPPSIFYAVNTDGLADGHSQGGATFSLATPGIFATLGLTFLEGETFAEDDKPDGPNYVVINRGLAQKLWPGQAALGRSFFARFGNANDKPMPVIVRGVVQDFQASGPKTKENDMIYGSLTRNCPPYLFVYVRGRTVAPSVEEIERAAHRVDPRLPIYLPSTLQKIIENQLGTVRLTSQLTTLFAGAAILLCAVGVYSITVSQIMQRNREFGIRMALGIEAERLWLRFARGHLVVAGIGVIIGLIAAAAVATVLQSLLFGVKPHDPATFLIVAVIIVTVSVLACLPSRFRLQRINPADCLRSL